MGFFFTHHVLDRMRERGISREALESVMHSSLPYQVGDVWYYDGVWEKKKLRIIVKRSKNHTIFITSYFYE